MESFIHKGNQYYEVGKLLLGLFTFKTKIRTPVPFHGREMWSLSLMEERNCNYFKTKCHEKYLGLEGITLEIEQLHSEELCNVRKLWPRSVRWCRDELER
jgi:hypothetical protein